MSKASFAVDLMDYRMLLRHLRRELRQLEHDYPPTYDGSPLRTRYERLNALLREIELRGEQGKLFP